LLLLTWGLGVFIVWVVLSLWSKTLVSIPPTVLAFLTTLVGGKLLQNTTEGANKET
jgi:hypothetical protein